MRSPGDSSSKSLPGSPACAGSFTPGSGADFLLNARLDYDGGEETRMCRNIRTLFNFDPPVTEDEVRAASLQFVRKITGFNKPSKANEESFHMAVEKIAAIAGNLLHGLETTAPPKNREEETAKARARAEERFGGAARA